MTPPAYTEHMAEILYRKITCEEEYLTGENLAITSDSIYLNHYAKL
jgi:hypothetical protein